MLNAYFTQKNKDLEDAFIQSAIQTVYSDWEFNPGHHLAKKNLYPCLSTSQKDKTAIEELHTHCIILQDWCYSYQTSLFDEHLNNSALCVQIHSPHL